MRWWILCCVIVAEVGANYEDWLNKMAGNVTEKPTVPPVEATNGCGYSFHEPKKWMVVHGKTAKSATFPWLVPFYRTENHVCSANILNRRWLLTAAHCVVTEEGETRNPHLFHVQPGDYQLDRRDDTEGRQKLFKVKDLFVHPDYIGKKNSYQHDLVMVKLRSELEYGERVQPVCLPKRGQNFERNRSCFMAGWGKTLDTKIAPGDEKKLQIMHDKVRSWSTCKTIWRHHLYDNHICYGDGDPVPCKGDSGGGLMCKDRDKSWKLAGIASWVWETCDKPGYPAVYVAVAPYLDWINTIMEKNS